MERSVELIVACRRALLKVFDGLSMDTLNAIPTGYSNNLIWNLGHVVASQQALCYLNADLKPLMDEGFFLKYRRGTKPVAYVEKAEFETLKNYSETTLAQLDSDLENNVFTHVRPFTITSLGFEIRSIQDVLRMLLNHEGLHLGYCMALKRAQAKFGNRSL